MAKEELILTEAEQQAAMKADYWNSNGWGLVLKNGDALPGGLKSLSRLTPYSRYNRVCV